MNLEVDFLPIHVTVAPCKWNESVPNAFTFPKSAMISAMGTSVWICNEGKWKFSACDRLCPSTFWKSGFYALKVFKICLHFCGWHLKTMYSNLKSAFIINCLPQKFKWVLNCVKKVQEYLKCSGIFKKIWLTNCICTSRALTFLHQSCRLALYCAFQKWNLVFNCESNTASSSKTIHNSFLSE